MKLSIIIVSWNVKDYLEQCLESIYKKVKGIELEIFVVDNNSSDNSVKVVKDKFPQVSLIINNENVGFSKANNQAIIKSSGKYVLLLNPDTIVLPGSIESMCRYLDENPNYGAIGPAILLDDFKTISPAGSRDFPTTLSIFCKLTKLDSFMRKPHDYSVPGETNVLSGACMTVRKKTIREIGLLDDNFFMYGEDIDWCYRIKKYGWKIYYMPTVGIVHYGERSAIKKFSDVANMLENQRSYFKYFSKTYGIFYEIYYRLMLISTMIILNFYWMVKLLLTTNPRAKEKFKGILKRNFKHIKLSITIQACNNR